MSAPVDEDGDPGNWIAVASAEHVRLGRARGFMQLGHGKAAPLRRLHSGDRIVYCSPTVTFGGRDTLQCFTAIGVVREREPYRAEWRGGCFRRDVAWLDASEAPIKLLLTRLAFTRGRPNWGCQLRFGLLAVGPDDMDLIAQAMRAALPRGAVTAAARRSG